MGDGAFTKGTKKGSGMGEYPPFRDELTYLFISAIMIAA